MGQDRVQHLLVVQTGLSQPLHGQGGVDVHAVRGLLGVEVVKQTG